ncbi:Fasciclin-like arabinogalactan protein 14 [Camellia lanceoleosa]|uniref:Fasciclin-like arabinogalactan protein 14 n=1 Tax=Camellia lanceoleosa TaxID=1840588 RepID=A0ACC0FM87_9ERIC|nr:Fasciclin-like arabinogalactan protein 14 [Camellia lanceoleosa]
MSPKSSLFVILSSFLLLSSAATAFNITKLLDRFPNYSTFNSLLSQTGLAKQINTRQTITVLAVHNDAMGALSSEPVDVAGRILSVHVILDYYDIPKLQQLSKKSSIVTTLYQASGIASTQQGFLNITDLPNHEVGFASAIKGSHLDVKLVNLVAAQPYNVSVLQVSGIIVTPGIDGNFTAPPKKAPAPAPSKAKAKAKKAPSPSPVATPTPTPTPSPADDVTADSPTESPAEAPVSSPPVSADAPAADGKEADAPAPSKSSAMRFAASGLVSGLVVALASAL